MNDKLFDRIILYRIWVCITGIYGLGVLGFTCVSAYVVHGFQNLLHIPVVFVIIIVLLTTCFFTAKKLFKLEKEYFSEK